MTLRGAPRVGGRRGVAGRMKGGMGVENKKGAHRGARVRAMCEGGKNLEF